EGFDGRLLLFGDEAERPYDHPPLSKAYLRGETDRDSLYVHEEGFYAAHGVELRTSTPVRSIDPGGHRLEVGSGEQISYAPPLAAHRAPPAHPDPGPLDGPGRPSAGVGLGRADQLRATAGGHRRPPAPPAPARGGPGRGPVPAP